MYSQLKPWLFAVVICLAVCLPLMGRGQYADEATIAAVAKQFFAAYQKQDISGLMALWSDKSPDLANNKQTFQQSFTANKIELKSIHIGKIRIENGKATVRV